MESTIEKFNACLIDCWIISDSFDRIASIVGIDQKRKVVSGDELLFKIQKFSLENPKVGIMILSEKSNGEMNNSFKEVLRPNSEGKKPKIVLAAENGATMQFCPIDDMQQQDIPQTHEHMHQMAYPLPSNFKKKIEADILQTIRKHSNNIHKEDNTGNKYISVGIKKYGFTVNYRKPRIGYDKTHFKNVQSKIKSSLRKLSLENDLQMHEITINFHTFEKTSKGSIINHLTNNSDEIRNLFKTQGLLTVKPVKIYYFIGGTKNFPIQSRVNSKLNREASIKDVSSPDYYNYTSLKPEVRTFTDSLDFTLNETFYFLQGMKKEVFKHLKKLWKMLELSQLLPSQNKAYGVPSIVVLGTGDILLQKPERYPIERLKNLENWNDCKVILMYNDDERLTKAWKFANSKIIIVKSNGNFIINGINIEIPSEKNLNTFKNNQKQILSANLAQSQKFWLLKSVEACCIENDLISWRDKAINRLSGLEHAQITRTNMPNKTTSINERKSMGKAAKNDGKKKINN